MVDVGGVLVVEHIVEIGHFAIFVTNYGEAEIGIGDFVDVLDLVNQVLDNLDRRYGRAYLDPSAMAVDRVGREPDQLDPTLCELGLELSEGTQLRRADWCVVFGMREEDDPFVANEPVL